jgi:hypothetical protein
LSGCEEEWGGTEPDQEMTMEMLGSFLLVLQALWCIKVVDKRQPLARWCAVGCFMAGAILGLADFDVPGIMFVAAGALIVAGAEQAKAKWIQRQKVKSRI